MSSPAASTASAIAASPGYSGARVCQRLVLNALTGLPRGELHVTLPDHSRHIFGRGHGQPGTLPGDASSSSTVSPPAQLDVRRPDFFKKCVLFGDVGFAESYIDGDWETTDIGHVIKWFLLNQDSAPTLSGSALGHHGVNLLRLVNRIGHRFRSNTRRTAARNIQEHYDLSNEFFRLWLDPTLMYSSARWTTPHLTLEQAQHAKNDSLCRKLQLTASDHVLEIGTGWGGWSLHAAASYGCRVTSLTLSAAQADFARQRVAAAGMSDRIEVRLQDYRDLPAHENFDKVVSIEMLEAVGHRYLETWCRLVSRVLKRDGLMALQFITCPDARYDALRHGVDFIQKHIFPGSLLLSTNRLNALLASTGGFVLHGLEDMGADYARTLQLWREEFHRQVEAMRALGFDTRFIRKWNYYLAYCEAAFAMRNISVVQTVHTRPNNLYLA